MDIRLDGRTALITGGSLGLGRAMALKFAKAGANVAIVARRQNLLDEAAAEIRQAAQARVLPLACDVRKPEEIKTCHAAIERDLGAIDILVNNAGTSATAAFDEISDEDWQHDLDLKFFAAVRFSRLAYPGMKARRWGRIINVLNIHAKTPQARTAPTSVSRAASMALTKVMAGEGAPHGVLVNAMLTGFFVTDQWHRHHQRDAPDLAFEEFIVQKGKTVPIGRFGTAEEFANMACFLASDAASYVTGTAINVDGGRAYAV